ncbi:MAG: carboxypeptidase regulatory-like domain-containing protein [Planctomycetes bacterium]|nr:carboxypeptidase regulatory-like domain-containing protein [Planctomycetota bacterium]
MVDDAGRPLAGAVVRLSKLRESERDAPSGAGVVAHPELTRVVTSADGVFVFDALPSGKAEFTLSGDGRVRRTLEVELVAGERARCGDVTLSSGRALRGTLVDVDGLPLGDVALAVATRRYPLDSLSHFETHVFFSELGHRAEIDDLSRSEQDAFEAAFSTRTAADGSFAFEHLGAARVTLFGLREGYESLCARLDVEDGVRLVLHRLPELELHFVDDESGASLPDVDCYASRLTQVGDEFGEAVGQEELGDGRVLLHGAGTLGTELFAWTPGYALLKRTLDGAEPDTRRAVEVRLARETIVRGVVRDDRGIPVVGAILELRSDVLFGDEAFRAVSGLDGAFTFAGLPGGTYTLDGRATDLVPAARRELVLPVAGSVELEPRLERFARLTGTLRAEEGAPLAGRELTLRRDDGGVEPMRATTDEAGAFAFLGLPPATYRLESDDTSPERLELRPGDDLQHDVVVPRFAPAVLTGRVVLGITPLAGVDVALRPRPALLPAAVPLSASTDATGRFRFELPAGGTWELELRSPHVVCGAPRPCTLEQGGEAHVELVLRGATLVGRVHGVPVADVAGLEVQLVASDDRCMARAALDERGCWRIEAVPPGEYRAVVEDDSRVVPGTVATIVVPDVVTAECDLTLVPPPTDG